MQGGLVRPAFAVLSAGILESTVNTETEKDRFMSENTKNPAAEEFLPVCKADMLALSLIHISEPTRLGMISYAVFCLKKKKKNKH